MSKKINNNKYNSIEFLKKENSSLTKLYKDALIKMKKIQKDYETMYSKFVNENQMRENFMKNNYLRYQDLLQQHFQKEENNYIEEIKNLKLQIQEKDKIINVLQNNNALLNDKLSKNELIFNLKEKEYQKQLLNKDRLLMKSSDIVKKNSKEVMEDIQKLKDELKYFQNKIFYINDNQNNTNNINSHRKTINSYSKSNLNNCNSEIDNYQLDSNISNCFCHCHRNRNDLNKSFNSVKCPNLKLSQFSNNQNDSSHEIYFLKNKINSLNHIIKKKDEEILFWKNLRKDLYLANNNENNKDYKDVLKTFKYELKKKNDLLSNLSTSNSNKKNHRRSNSQSSSHILPFKKNMNLNLVDSNVNKPIIKDQVSSEDKKK